MAHLGIRSGLARDTELQAWLADQQGVVVGSYGGMCPGEWSGEVDGHSFYFRDRLAKWRIEVDVRPSGCFIRTVAGAEDEGTTCYEERELDEGDVIACGTTDVEGYGDIPLERARFVADTIRIHLVRRACTLHHNDLSAIHAALGTAVRWCPACGSGLGSEFEALPVKGWDRFQDFNRVRFGEPWSDGATRLLSAAAQFDQAVSGGQRMRHRHVVCLVR